MKPIVAQVWFELPHNIGLVTMVTKRNLDSPRLTGAVSASTSEV
jgi:hypothetical protein